MAELNDMIVGRRSIRKFSDRMPEKAQIEAVMEAGLWAASGMGRQSSIVIAVTNREMRDKIMAANAGVMGREGMDPFYGAPVILVVAAKKDVVTAVYDGSLTLGNMMLRAHELGLASCWIHRAKEEFEGEIGREILNAAGVEGEYIGVGHLALGYADGELPEAAPRKEGRTFFVD